MLKKAIPLVLVSGLALTACATTNNGAGTNVPRNNETPMENLNRDVTPRVNHGAGPDMDGVDNGRYRNNGVNEGVINDRNRNGLNGTEEIIIDENRTGPNGERIIIEDRNRNGNTINNR